ncbi:MAG TPA: hypothetical protein VIL63_07910 [Terriglobales bacterium]
MNQASDHKIKIYVTKTKVRIEDANSMSMGAMIIDMDNRVTDFVMPQRHMYIESASSQPMPMSPNIFQFFRAADPEDACSHWEKIARDRNHPDYKCRKVGDETVNGRDTVKYEGTSSKQSGTDYVWIDKKIDFPVKWQQASEKSGELRNIQTGPQAGSLFEIPAGYQKMDASQMMRGAPQR